MVVVLHKCELRMLASLDWADEPIPCSFASPGRQYLEVILQIAGSTC